MELTKSSYVLMAWKLKTGKNNLFDIIDAPGTLSRKSEKYQGMRIELTRKEARAVKYQLRAMLSVCVCGGVYQYIYRLDQSKILICKIIYLSLTRKDAEIIYKEQWISLVGYCLPITQFTAKQCDVISQNGL